MNKNKLLLIVAILQISFFIIWYWLEHNKLHNPKSQEILVKTTPLDPRDYLSGNYFILNYAISNINNYHDNKKIDKSKSTEIYAVLKKDKQWFVADYITINPPKVRDDQVAIRGMINPDSPNIIFGIEKYFINENTKEPNRDKNIEVLLIIGDDYSARIKAVLVDGVEFKG
jgi:uncharacterized membrane-anchored protein